RALARLQLDEDLSARVLQSLSEQQQPVVRYSLPAAPIGHGGWLKVGVAAAVALAVVLGSYLFYSKVDTERGPAVVKNEPKTLPKLRRRRVESDARPKWPENEAPSEKA